MKQSEWLKTVALIVGGLNAGQGVVNAEKERWGWMVFNGLAVIAFIALWFFIDSRKHSIDR